MNSQRGTESLSTPSSCDDCPHFRADAALRRVNAALEQQARSIGQALHDETGQTLAVAQISLAEAYESAHSTVRVHLTSVKNNLEALEKQIRQLSHELRPRVLDELGLIPALNFLVEGMRMRSRITISFVSKLEGRLAGVVETAIYRLVQEALTNVHRHSRATHVLVELEERRPGLLWCRIRDNGIGIGSPLYSPSGLGQFGIRDRLLMLGATMTADAEPGCGTELLAIIPVEGCDAVEHSAR